MMFMSFNSNTTGVTCGEDTASHSGEPTFTPAFSGVSVTRSCFCVMFCRSLFALLSLFFWPLCCLSILL